MVLDKAEPAEADVVEVIITSNNDADSEAPRLHVTSPRPNFNPSLVTLQDIEPAPELRVQRYDTSASNPDSSFSSSENAHLLSARLNASTASLDTTVEDVAIDGMPRLSSTRRESGASFFESPIYANRSRSRSFDVSCSSIANGEDDTDMGSLSRPSLDLPRERRQSSGFRSLFHRPSASQGSLSLLPLHSTPSTARRSAVRNREISAPLSDTLVRASYQPPKAGINPLQAAWLGSRDAISRITTYLDTAPPAFVETAEEAEEEGEEEDDVGPLDEGERPAPLSSARPSAGRTMSQMEEESAQLSSLVQRASMRRVSLPPHLVALPPSLPASPTSGPPMDWPARRHGSISSELSRSARTSLDLAASPVRRHASSSSSQSTINSPRKMTRSDPTATAAGRPESPTPLSTVNEAAKDGGVHLFPRMASPPFDSQKSISTLMSADAEDKRRKGRLASDWSISTYVTANSVATVTAAPPLPETNLKPNL